MADLGSLLGAAGIGGAIGKAVVQLELDTAKYQAELKTAQASTVAGTNTMSSGLGKFSGLAQTAFLGVGVAAVAGIGVAIKAGSDLNEQLNKTRVVFEDSADSVIAFSETTASSLGIAQSEALEAAGNFGQLFQAAGFAEEAAAGMSTQMVQLSADLGSFNNIPVAEALEKIRSGLAGEAEPLRQLGVFLSEAAVEAEAFRSGIAKQGAELTDAQKIQARYNIILDSTTKAQGDFNRTLGESLPNQLKVLKAELTDTAAAIGTALLPVALELAKALLGIVEQAEPLLEVIGKLAPAVEILGKAFQFMLSPAAKVIGVIQTGIEPTDEMVRVIGSAAINLGAMKQKAEIAAAATAELTTETKRAGNAASKADVDFADFTLSLDESAQQTIITRQEFLHATNVMQREARQLATAMREIAKEDWVNPQYIAFLSEQGPAWLIGFSKLTEQQQHIAQQAWRDSTKELDNARGSQDKMLEALDKLDRGVSRHTVIIDYRYVNFDPSKPGMSPQQR